MRTVSATLLAGLLLSAASTAAPIQITGKILNAPRDVQVELRPWAVEYAEALRRLKGEAVPPIASAKPRPDGSFALKVPDSGFYSVVVRAPGRLALEHFVQFVVEETETPPVELPPVSPLEVKAVGPDGQPLAGVTIQALPLKQESEDWRAAERSAVTDAEGRAVFSRAEGEALTLAVTTPGRYATATTGAKSTAETVRFPAPRSRTVEIRNANNKPAAGALVRLARRGWPYGLTGEDGRIALPVPEKNDIGLVAEDARGLRIEIVMTVEAGEGTDVPVVALRSPTLAAGRVLEASSREPIPGALVWNGGTAWTRTGGGGTFELRAPSGDHGRIEGTAAGHTRDLQPWQRGESAPVTLTLGPASSISGQVVDEAGKPVADAQVATVTNPEDVRTSREDQKTRSGPDGRFVLRRLPAGRPHSVTAVLEGFAPATQIGDSKAPVRLVLRRGTIAVGRVVDDQGLPVAGAELALLPSRMMMAVEPAPGPAVDFSAVSDAEGRFRLENVSSGRFDLRASRRGFALAVVEGVTIPEGAPQADLGEVALRPGGAIEGIVVDEGGKPVQKAGVIMTGSDAFNDPAFFFRPPVETDADGRFRLEDLPRGRRVGLKVMHRQLVSTEVPGVEVPTAEPLRIQLRRPRSVEGRVTDKLGEPVAGARVSVVEGPAGFIASVVVSEDMRGRSFASSDAEGRFVLSGLKPGTVDLRVMASGYRTRTSPGIRIPEEGQATPVEITLEPGIFLEGVVLDSGGYPVRDARVHVQTGDRSNFQILSALTDEEGHFELGDLKPGPHQVTASRVRGGATAHAAVEIRPGRNRLDLKIPAGSEVSGRAVDADGSPLSGVTLSLQRQPSDGAEIQFLLADRFQAVSSADGSFVFRDVTDGDYLLNGQRQGLGAASLPGGVRVAGGPVAGLELRLEAAATIRGRLLGIAPEQSARVMIAAHSAETGVYVQGVRDPSGGYRIEDVAPGTWTVTAFLPPQAPVQAEVQVAPGQEEVVQDLELTPGFTLTGRLLLDQSPVAGARVIAQIADPEIPAGGQSTTGHDGSFRLERLAAGSYRLMVLLSSGVTHAQTLEIAGDRDVVVEIAAGTVEGRLLTAEGLPVAGAAISLKSENPELEPYFPGPIARSDDQGAFELPRVAAGSYRIIVEADGFAPAESRIVVTPGGIARVDLLLNPD